MNTTEIDAAICGLLAAAERKEREADDLAARAARLTADAHELRTLAAQVERLALRTTAGV
ncbi:MAG: hypothetical protein HY039_11765 [Nitrospirae bacterium]|nr:hypothetical protein [Nitrospirota bacterium]